MSLLTIHEVSKALGVYLLAHGCAVPVVNGPETKRTSYAPEAIVIEHDADGKDSFGNPRGLHTNAKHRYLATDTFKLTIYVQSRVAGAKVFEHRQRAKLVREAVMVALDHVAADLSRNARAWKPTSGGLVAPADIADSEQPGGAAYEMKFTYDLPVREVTFAGAARAEASIVDFQSSTRISRTGTADDDDNPNTPSLTSETACGA